MNKFFRSVVLQLAGVLVSFFVVNQAMADGGIQLGSTRVILQSDKKDAQVTVINTSDTSFLVQSWVGDYSQNSDGGNAQKKFIVTPPLYRQGKGENTLRIVSVSPVNVTDRESVYSLYVKTVPESKKLTKDSNYLQFAYVMKIKLFYRPAGLSGKSQDAYKQLSFSRQGGNLVVRNPTPYYVTLNKIVIGGRDIKDVTAMVPPLGTQSYPIPGGASGEVVYKTINDFGGLTPDVHVSL